MSSWYDMMAAEEQRNTVRIVRMTPAEWKAEIRYMLQAVRGDVRDVLAYIRAMDDERVASAAAAASSPVVDQSNLDLRVWRDMVESPEKYGDDIVEWLELDAKLRAGMGHWRIEAYWFQKEAEMEEAEANAQIPWRDIYLQVAKAAAAKGEREWFRRDVKRLVLQRRKALLCIQSAVRGHLVRGGIRHMDCCMCLAHRVCPLKTTVGMMCRECAEQGPHDDITGPVSDPWNWFRGDYEDLATPDPPVCQMCGDNADGGDMAGTWRFCSRQCKTAWCREE
jgi:hypothetical protein